MGPKIAKITPEDRRFFKLVAAATFANPFDDEREQIDLEIIGKPKGLSREERVRHLRGVISERVAKLEERGLADLHSYSGEDFEAVQVSFLFDVYHRYYDDFDQLILDQIEAEDPPCPVPFAADAIGLLERRGFSSEEARRYFALLYQIRRAYYFVDRALIGRSPCMKELRRHLWNSVFTHDVRWYERFLLDRMEDFSTLLLGETGTGKGTAAAAIGRSGFIPFDDRKGRFVESFTRAFISINLSQYPEQLIESELFGHKKGAFTGAIEDHDGVFSCCSPHGAIFLDEIGEASGSTQIKLLHVLQDRVFQPVGGREDRRFRGRVIAATNRAMAELRGDGGFRDDFFYRLCSHIITVPPLRRRLQEDPAELDDLLRHTLRRLAGEDDPDLLGFVRERICHCIPEDYPWHGNVRELEQCVRRILLTSTYRPLEQENAAGAPEFFARMEDGALSAHQLLSGYCAFLYERYGTLAEVARRTQLDRRTVKKHVEEGRQAQGLDGEAT